MDKIKIIFIFKIFFIMSIILCSCCSNSELQKKAESTQSKVAKEEVVSDASKKNTTENNSEEYYKNEEVAKRLLSEFKEYLDKTNNNFSHYNLVMASSKAIGIMNVYKKYLKDEDVLFVLEKKKIIDRKLGDFSTIFFGYSNSGLRITALAQPRMTNNYDFSTAMNKIRGEENETEILNLIGLGPIKNSYFALDIKVEDLIHNKKEVDIDVTINNYVDIQYPINTQDNKLLLLLSKYNREFNNNDTIFNNEWKLYFFKDGSTFSEIRIFHEGEEIILEN